MRAMTPTYRQQVPQDVADRFRALTGIDVAGIPVHRGPAVTEQARAYQARAFTRAGEIFLPDEAGPLEHGDTRALLAHELTHAIQQRILSPSLPAESSPHGQELEGEASHAERWYRSGGEPPPRLAHLPVAMLIAGHAARPVTTGSAVQRQPDGHPPPPASVLADPAQGAGSGLPFTTGVMPDDIPAADVMTELPGTADPTWPAAPQGLPGGVLTTSSVLTAQGGPTAEAVAREEQITGLLASSARLAELSAARPANLDDPVSLDELATKVYQRLRGMLRAELLVDRERAGLLADIS
jgi:hypothetical protein